MKTSTFKRRVSEVRRLIGRGEYSRALEKLESTAADWPSSAVLRVLRAELVQLGDENGPPLEEAKVSLEEAIDLDDGMAEAWIENGHFQFSVEDNAAEARKSFDKAIQVAARQLMEALLGKALALAELNEREKAFDCLFRAHSLRNFHRNGSTSAHAEQQLLDALGEVATATSR